MEILLYLGVLLPALIMTLAGIVIASAKKSSIMTKRHFSKSVNIRRVTVQTVLLFMLSGLLFSLGGMLILLEHTAVGLAMLIITLAGFIAAFIKTNK